jgi:hypothetical protein
MGILDKQFDVVTGYHLFIDTPTGGGNTTVNTAAAAGQNTVVLASATNFAVGDDIRIGSGEDAELHRIATLVTNTVTTERPLLFPHPVGDPVVEMSALDLGVPEADGVRFNCSVESTDVFSAIQKLAYGTLIGYGDLTMSGRYMAVTADIIALALGLPRSSVLGNGTAAAQTGAVGPRLFTTDGVAMGALANACAVVTGTLNDGSRVKGTFNGLSFNPTVFTTTFSRGSLATVPFSALAASAAFDFTNTAFSPANVISTFASSNADLFAEITSVNELSDAGTATTLSAGVAAGVYSVTCASAAGFAAGDWVRVGTGANAEYHLVHAVATNTLNLRTQVLRAQASGTAVVKQVVTDVGGIDGGFTLATPGQVTPQRSETRRLSLKYRTGNIGAQLSFNATGVTPENLQRAFGIAASAYAGSVLPITSNTVARALNRTFLFLGLTQGGRTISICGWNGTCQPTGELNMTQASALTIPIAYKPNVLQVLVNQ